MHSNAISKIYIGRFRKNNATGNKLRYFFLCDFARLSSFALFRVSTIYRKKRTDCKWNSESIRRQGSVAYLSPTRLLQMSVKLRKTNFLNAATSFRRGLRCRPTLSCTAGLRACSGALGSYTSRDYCKSKHVLMFLLSEQTGVTVCFAAIAVPDATTSRLPV